MVEFNIISENRTIHMQEYHDWKNNRGRWEHFSKGIQVTNLLRLDLDPPLHFVMAHGNCTVSVFNHSMTHLQNSSRFFGWDNAAGGSEKYIGLEWVRGIHTDTWERNYTETVQHGPSKGAVKDYMYRFHFSVNEWTEYGHQDVHRVPIRAYVAGNETFPNGTRIRFSHSIEFVNFVPGSEHIKSWAWCHNAHCKWKNTNETYDRTTDPYCSTFMHKKSSAYSEGDMAGGVIGGMILGSILVAGVVFIVYRRRATPSVPHAQFNDET